MRQWDTDNPKAGLMAKKRAAILAAARQEFLTKGFGSTTMAGVAAAAGVSVATLYRHARTKDELFDAIVRLQQDPAMIEAALRQMAAMPLEEALLLMGQGMLFMLLSPDIVATHRMVIAEVERFPHLGQVAYGGILGHLRETLTNFLAPRIGAEAAGTVAPEFLARVIGERLLQALLGVYEPAAPEAEVERVRKIIRELISPAAA